MPLAFSTFGDQTFGYVVVFKCQNEVLRVYPFPALPYRVFGYFEHDAHIPYDLYGFEHDAQNPYECI